MIKRSAVYAVALFAGAFVGALSAGELTAKVEPAPVRPAVARVHERVLLPGQSLAVGSWKRTPSVYDAAGRRLAVRLDTYPGFKSCPQYAMDDGPTVAGYVSCNRELFVYGKRPVIVKW